jgi:hypothetical protein
MNRRAKKVHNPYLRKKKDKKQPVTMQSQPNQSQPNQSCAPGFNLPDVDVDVDVDVDDEEKRRLETVKLIADITGEEDPTSLWLDQIDEPATAPVPQAPIISTATAEKGNDVARIDFIEVEKGDAASLSKIATCLRDLVSSDTFPRLNKEGGIYLVKKGLVGKQASNAAQYMSERETRQFVKKRFPANPLVDIENPEIRALAKKGDGRWTPDSIRQARDCFYIPASTRCIVVWPDLFDRDELIGLDLFQKKNADGNVTGVMTPCPYCQSNKHVTLSCFNVQKWGRRPRRAVDSDGTNNPFVGPLYMCDNFQCVGKIPRATTASWDREVARAERHTFLVWTKKCFEMYPLSVRRRYSRFASGLGINADNTTIATQSLSMELLDDRNTFQGIQDRMWRKFDGLWIQARDAYTDFVCQYGRDTTKAIVNILSFVLSPRTQDVLLAWPDLSANTFEKENAPPKEDAIETLFYIEYERVKPYLLRDLYSRLPTRYIYWDATFEIAGRTMNDILPDGPEQKAIAIIFDQFGRILIYGYIDKEQPTHWKRLMHLLRLRCQWHGPSYDKVVEFGGSDLCCENCIDRTKHWFVNCWPNVKEAPFRDIFHAIKMVTGPGSVRTSHDLHANFCRQLSSHVLLFDDDSVLEAIDHFRADNPEMSPQMAKEAVLADAKWRAKIINYTAPIHEAELACRQLFRETELEDKRMQQECEAAKTSYQSYIMKPIKGKRRGGAWEMENFIRHLKKGCYRDYLPPKEMSYPKKKPNENSNTMVDLGRFRSTGGGESSNKQVNGASNNATRLSSRLSDSKILLRIVRLDRDKDVKFQHVTGEEPKEKFWFLHEEIDKRQRVMHMSNTSSTATKYPKELNGYDEPIGIEFARYRHWESIDRALHFENAKISQAVSVPPIPSPFASLPVVSQGFSAGNTTWNRKEGNKTRSPPHKFSVREPLTSVQEAVLAEIVSNIQRYYASSTNTITSFAEKVVQIWNHDHFGRLGRREVGLGGVLPIDISRRRAIAMSNSAVASRDGPLQHVPIFFTGPPMTGNKLSVATKPLLIPPTAIAKIGGRPKSEPKEFVPLKKLTIDMVNLLTVRELRVYTKQICGTSPADKKAALQIVLEYISSSTTAEERNKKQRRY